MTEGAYHSMYPDIPVQGAPKVPFCKMFVPINALESECLAREGNMTATQPFDLVAVLCHTDARLMVRIRSCMEDRGERLGPTDDRQDPRLTSDEG